MVLALLTGSVLIPEPDGTLGPDLGEAIFVFLVTSAVMLVALKRLQETRALLRDGRAGREAAQLVDTILDTTQEWFWGVDEHGPFTFSSPSSKELLGYLPEELIGGPSIKDIIYASHLMSPRRLAWIPA
jgi:PAS domain-containing protein